MKPLKLTELTKSDVHTIKNEHVAFDIEKKTGWIRSMVWPRQGVDLFQQLRGGIPGYAGGIRIFDEEDRVWYSDYDSTFSVSNMRKSGKAVTFNKQFKDAPFSVTVTMKMDRDCLNWDVEAEKKNKKVKDRSLRVYFSLPLIAGWDYWAPCNYGEKTFDGMTPFEFMYTQVPYVSDQEIILPMVSHYSKALRVGYSIVDPIDANVPAAKFGFENLHNCYNWGSMNKDPRTAPMLHTCNYYIGLVGERKMKTKVMVFAHEGDWRPGVGMVYKRWQEYFDPFNDSIYEHEGVFQCGGIQNADHIKDSLAMGLKTLEVHGHFQDYGDYYQDGKDKWYTIDFKETLRRALLEDLNRVDKEGGGEEKGAECVSRHLEAYIEAHTDKELAKKAGMPVEKITHTRADIKDRLQKLTDAGIACHWYFNYTDGYRPHVEKEWPDAICRDDNGDPIPSGWYMNHTMNADPKFSFGKFCYESARKIVDEYPMLKGFFLDCFRHHDIDFGHDDGVTVVNGKPAYSVNHSYDDIEKLIKTRVMKPRNLTSFANKPMSMRIMRYCDGQLLEGNGQTYEERFFWASIACPMFLMWTRRDRSIDEFLRRSLLHGCYPRDEELTPENIKRYQAYLPLYKEFKRRVLCFEPDPIRGPRNSRCKLYTVKDGYVASIVNTSIDVGDTVRWGHKPYALFRVEQGHNIGKVGVMYPGDDEMREVRFAFDGTYIVAPLKDYVNCAVVKLFVTGKSKKQIGDGIFSEAARMCGDPESSFEDISDR